MTVPKLTWDEYKDADGVWKKHWSPSEVIALQRGEIASLKERIAALEAALQRSDAMLSLLRFRAERTIPWGDVGYPERHEVDQVIAQSRAALGP